MELRQCPKSGAGDDVSTKTTVTCVGVAGNMWNETHSNMTMATASLSRLSPKMTLYSLGSTLRVLKMASWMHKTCSGTLAEVSCQGVVRGFASRLTTVTGSVALKVEPKTRHSMIPNDKPSSPNRPQIYTRTLY